MVSWSQTTLLFYKLWHNPIKHCPVGHARFSLCHWRILVKMVAGRWPPHNSMGQVYLRGELLCHHLRTCNGRSGCDTLQPPNCLISCTKPNCNPAIFSSLSFIPVSNSFFSFLFFSSFPVVMPTPLHGFVSIPSQLHVCIGEEITALIIRLTVHGPYWGPVMMTIPSCSW